MKSWGQHLLFDTKLDMIQLIIYDETFWVSCSRKSQKGFYKNPAPKIAIKAAFPAPEIAKICQFKAPKWAKKALLIFRRRKSPKRGDFRRRKSPFSSRDPLWFLKVYFVYRVKCKPVSIFILIIFFSSIFLAIHIISY